METAGPQFNAISGLTVRCFRNERPPGRLMSGIHG